MTDAQEFWFFTSTMAIVITWFILFSISYELSGNKTIAAWHRLIAVLLVPFYIFWMWASI